MPLSSDNCRSNCPINFILETLGDKWTLLVIRDLMFHGKRQFSEFMASDEGISTNILADRLQRLEQEEIVEKELDPENRSRVLYELTDKGKDLLPVMLEITAWSGKYDSETNAPRQLLKALKRGKRPLAEKMRRDLD